MAVVFVLALLFTTSGTTAGAVLTAHPKLITHCSAGQPGRTTVRWDSGGVAPVRIVLISPDGKPMTGPEGATGAAVTGDWVADGLTFFLADDQRHALADVTVGVDCGQVSVLDSTRSYFPFRRGNRWTYEYVSRWVPRDLVGWSVTQEVIKPPPAGSGQAAHRCVRRETKRISGYSSPSTPNQTTRSHQVATRYRPGPY